MSEAKVTSTARAPFDNPEGDIIFRSADGVHFHIFKLILSLASDVFQSMFTLPQDTMQSDVPSIPIIPITESSTIFESLLLLCYPSQNPVFETLEDAKAVLEAAKKYDMQAAISRAKDIIFAQFLEAKPLELYALSCVFGWKQLAQRAASQTLQINLKDPGRPDSEFTGMRDMSAFHYHRLQLYHHECGIAAKAVGESLAWLPQNFAHYCMWECVSPTNRSNPVAGFESSCRGVRKIHVANLGNVLITPWFDEYLVSSGKELYARPCESTMTVWIPQDKKVSTYDFALIKASNSGCNFCRTMSIGVMRGFHTAYAARVAEVLAKVELKLNDD